MPNEITPIQESQTWSSVAGGWRRWWNTIEEAAQIVNEGLCDQARIEPGSTVLDVCCGIGEPAVTASRRASSGRVLAVDFASEMLTNARMRACAHARCKSLLASPCGNGPALTKMTALRTNAQLPW